MILQGVGLTHKFDYTLFSDINFDLNLGQSISIVGRSGCGKSTLLHILSTLLKPDSGEVFYNNRSIYNLTKDERVEICRYDFGIIFQAHYLFKGFSARENIELAALLAKQKIDLELLKELEIDDILDKKVGELSGGQQQRVSIARILTKKPKIIFADEPTGNLDQKTAAQIMAVIFRYIEAKNAALLLVTHDTTLAKKCLKTYTLQDQSLIEI